MEIIKKANAFILSVKGKWAIISLIVIVNISLYNIINVTGFSDTIQARKDASGFSIDTAQEFIYYYYYTGVFPLASLNKDLIYKKSEALKEISENGEDLIMEYQHWSRYGEHGRMWAFLPNAYLKGSPYNPSIKLFNSIIFSFGLIILFLGFRGINYPLSGLFIVLLINFTPYFLYEVYANENIFSLLASSFFIVLGSTIHLLFKGPDKLFKLGGLIIFLSFFIGIISEVRNETTIVIGSLLLIILLAKKINLIVKLGLVLLCYLSFTSSKSLIQSHFNNKFDESYQLVKENGGHVYDGVRVKGHTFWHPIFCGLGDFDTKYGYEWKDRVAYQYALPVLKEKYDLDINYSGNLSTDDYYDKAKLYYIKLEEVDEYEQVVKDKVISDIKNDPFWYAEIILKRIAKVLTTTIPFPYAGWILIPLLVYLLKKRMWSYFKLIFVSLPLSLSPIIIYSDKGSTYNSVFLYMIILVLLFLWKDYTDKKLRLSVE